MRTAKSLLVLLIAVVFVAGDLSAITSDELAAYLGISSWHTAVDLPQDLYTVEIHEFANGKVEDAHIIALPEFSKHPEVGLTIVSGPQNGKYRFVIMGWNGSSGVGTQEATFGSTVSGSLPEKVKAGDFVLFGEPLEGAAIHGSDDIRSFSKGFLLRIKKRE